MKKILLVLTITLFALNTNAQVFKSDKPKADTTQEEKNSSISDFFKKMTAPSPKAHTDKQSRPSYIVNYSQLKTGIIVTGVALTATLVSIGIIHTNTSDPQKIESINETQRGIFIAGGAITAIGTIVAITSFKKATSDGIKVGENLYIQDKGIGASLAWKF